MSKPCLSDRQIFALKRPMPRLLAYYALLSLLAGPFFPLVLVPLWIRYQTLRFCFDEEGVSLR